VLVAVVLGGLRGSRRRSGGGGGRRAVGGQDHVPWGGPDEPFHPRDQDLRDRAYGEAEARHRQNRTGTRAARLDERYGGDFGPPPDGA